MSIGMQLAAIAASIAGALCLYLAAPRQQMLARPWPVWLGGSGALALAFLGWLVWCRLLDPAAAFFSVLITAMATLLAVPVLSALIRLRRGNRA